MWLGKQTAVDPQGLATDEVGGGTRQEYDELGNILRESYAAHRRHLRPEGGIFSTFVFRSFYFNRTWSGAVHAHFVLAQLDGRGLREHLHAALARCIVHQ